MSSAWPAARRPIRALADEIGGTAIVADVTDDEAVTALASALDRVDVLVNNAGGARGLEPVMEADLDHWRWMWESNVLGTLRVTRALLPKLIDSGDGLIVTVTSTAAIETYDNGSGYTSAKHAQGALHRTLRGELLGKPVRLTEIAPGMVKTDFSLRPVRGRRGPCGQGLRGRHSPSRRGRRRGDRFRRVPPVARRPGPDRDPAARPGQRLSLQPEAEQKHLTARSPVDGLRCVRRRGRSGAGDFAR